MKNKILIIGAMLVLQNVKAADFFVCRSSTNWVPTTLTTCPFSYVSYDTYVAPSNGGWWKLSTNTTIHRVTDTNRTDTHLIAGGRFGDTLCSSNIVTLSTNPVSPSYRFTIYFPTNPPHSNMCYYLHFEGFEQ